MEKLIKARKEMCLIVNETKTKYVITYVTELGGCSKPKS